MDALHLATSWKRSRKTFGSFVNGLDDKRIAYLSHSKLALYERCPRCYHRRYILQIPEEENEAMRCGQFFHSAAASMYSLIRDKQSLPTFKKLLPAESLKRLTKESVDLLSVATELLRKHRWVDHEVMSVEEPFFMDLIPKLPPIIGVTDLVLRRNETWLIVDHKTSKEKADYDSSQLVLYAEYIRRANSAKPVVGVYDHYRLVSDLEKTTKYPLQRIPVSVDSSLLPSLIARYRKAWKKIAGMNPKIEPTATDNCWSCWPKYY